MTSTDTDADYGSALAIIGMSGRFPGAPGVAELWDNLAAGRKGLRELDEDELRAAGVPAGLLADPRYVRVGADVAQPDHFDAAVFGINPREAATMDPQHRMFLECSWEVLEGAGYCPNNMSGQVAVFAGCGFPDYIAQNLMPMMSEPGGGLLVAIGNERDSLASLVSYKLGLRGPAIAVQTFCSTSLVAVHLACQSLLTYECDIAIAGGAFVPLPQPSGHLYLQGGILSPDGRVRSFDAQANGTVMGSGVGTVALKRMSEAVEDGDIIHAVILGSAVNNDGRVRAGYTAPGVDGEAEVIELALGVAGVKPDTIGYVECHATGTPLGDSIELAALNRVFAQARETPCVLSTVKPSIGHLDRASGVTGLMRAALSLEHEILPATPDFQSPNTALADVQERLTVLTEHRPWPAGPTPRRAGVSSFGLGGTNAHVVLEQAPPRPVRPHRDGPHLLTLSGVDAAALDAVTTRLRAHLIAHPDVDLADVAYTLQVSRGAFPLRRAVVCTDVADALGALEDPARWIEGRPTRRDPRLRLGSDGAVPDTWWAELSAAVGGAASPASPDSARNALSGWLTGLGVHLTSEPVDAVDELVVDPAGVPAARWLMDTLARLWIGGSTIDWSQVHGGAGRRVKLPTYPFQRRRYWVDAVDKADAAPAAGRTFDRSQWTYLPTWQQRPPRVADVATDARDAGPWLLLGGEDRTVALALRLRGYGADVTIARPGAGFERDGFGGFTVRPDDADDLAAVLAAMDAAPRTIVHAFSLADPRRDDGAANFRTEQDRGLFSALALARALVDDSDEAPRVELVLLTSGAVAVGGSDLLHPEHATLAALAPTLAQENPRVRCRHVDVDTPTRDGLPDLVTQLIAASVAPHEGPTAIRSGETWRRSYQLHPIDEPVEPVIADGDTVLITGGLGDVGLTLAKHLAERYRCNLVLTARTALPPREDWPSHLAATPPGADRAVRHIRNIVDLEERGAQVLAMSADVADAVRMTAVLDAAHARFGPIDVVVHAAGVQNPRYFDFAHLIDRASCDAHLAAKVDGFHVLQSVLGDEALERRITLSSIAAVLGGMTLGPYASANAALDAYARRARAAGQGRWISVNWDTWNVDPERVNGHSADVADFAMTPTEAVDVFERTLSAGADVARLVVSTGALDPRIDQWVISDLHGGSDEDLDSMERHPRPDLSTPFVAPKDGTEAALAKIWSAVLNIDPVGSADNFFELGGHSLIAIDLTHRIRKALRVPVPVTALLECPTVAELAVLIESQGSDSGGADDGD